MKRYFLVDYEIVQNLDGIENLTETDVVILLFMDDTKGVSFRTLAKMQQSRAEIQQRLINGNQETDMCYAIAFLAGQISAKDDEIVLIARSNDFSLFLKTLTEGANIKLSNYESIEQFLGNKAQATESQVEKPETNEVTKVTEVTEVTADMIDKNLPLVPLLRMILDKICVARRTNMNEERTGVLNTYFWVVKNKPEIADSVAVIVSQRLGFSVEKLTIYAGWYREMLKENHIS